MSRHHLRFEFLETRSMFAATLFVDPSVAPNGNIFATIGAAVTAAHNGDTIKVVGGTYTEEVVVNKPLTLVGGAVRVPGQSGPSIVMPAAPGVNGFVLEANSVTVKNFTIKNAATGVATNANFSGYQILHNKFLDDEFGIDLNTSFATTAKKTLISRNKFTDDGQGIATDFDILSHGGLRNVTISANTSEVPVNGSAIAFEIDGLNPSVGVQILNNRILGGNGIVVANMANAKINGNSISVPAVGATAIHLAGAVTMSEIADNLLVGTNGLNQALSGIQLDQSLVATPDTGNKISGNTLTGRSGQNNAPLGFVNGIVLNGASQNMITANFVAYSRDIGIDLMSSDSNMVSSNTVTNSGLGQVNTGAGIRLLNSNGNTLSKNVAIANQVEGIILADSNANLLKGNTASFSSQNVAAGIELAGSSQNKLTGNITNSNLRSGILLFSNSNNNTVSGNTAARNNIGFEVSSNSTQNTFSGNTASANFNNGFVANSGSNNSTFTKNIAKNNLALGFVIQATNCTFSANTVNNSGGVSISGDSNVVKGNMISNCFDRGIVISGQMATVSANIVKNNQGNGIRLANLVNSTVSGNVVMNNDGDGIRAESNASGNTIRGNTAMGNGEAVGGFDLLDLSTGTGTAGTANTWLNNKSGTRNPAGLL